MAGTRVRLSKLAKQIERTPGFERLGRSRQGIKFLNQATKLSYTIHLTPGDSRAEQNLFTNLKKWGWTPEMYVEAERHRRQERKKESAERQARMHLSQIPPVVFQTPNGLAPANGSNNNIESERSGGTMIPNATIEEINREIAVKYFDMRLQSTSNTTFGICNRHFSTAAAANYAKAMLRGEWMLNPDGLKFARDSEGREWMIDGQTRIGAYMIASEEYERLNGRPMDPIKFYVFRDVPHELFRVLDTGRKRTISQTLQMLGVPNYTVISSALRYVHLWFTVPDQKRWRNAESLTNTQIESLLHDYPDIITDSYKISSAANACGMSKSALVISAFLIRYYVPEATYSVDADSPSPLETFIKDIRVGAGLADNDPVLVTRNYMVNRGISRLRRQDASTKMGVTEVMFHMMLILRAWNHRARGKTISSITWRPEQEIPVPLTPRNT